MIIIINGIIISTIEIINQILFLKFGKSRKESIMLFFLSLLEMKYLSHIKSEIKASAINIGVGI